LGPSDYNAVIAKVRLGLLSDFAMPEYDYEAFASASNQFGQWNFPTQPEPGPLSLTRH
jgi:hypothetical protein